MSRALSRVVGLAACASTPLARAFAEPAAAPAAHPFAAPQLALQGPTSTASQLGQVTLALLLVLAAVFAVAWSVRRMRGMGNRVKGAVDVLASISLGQKERAVLVKVGHVQLLLGVAPGQVNTLHVLSEPIEPPPVAAGDRPTFRALMRRSLGKS